MTAQKRGRQIPTVHVQIYTAGCLGVDMRRDTLSYSDAFAKAHPNINPDLFVNCIGFTDPPSNHCGENEELLTSFATKPKHKQLLRQHLQSIKASVTEIVRGTNPSISIVCVCRSGRHRSVAVSRILLWIFEQLGYSVPAAATHLNKKAWGRHLCHTCRACTTLTSKKRAALEAAFEMW